MAKKKDKLPPICEAWRESARRRREMGLEGESTQAVVRYGGWGNGGICFQEAPGWSDGKPGLKYVEKGPHKGRLTWHSRAEAKEVAKRISDARGISVEYDP